MRATRNWGMIRSGETFEALPIEAWCVPYEAMAREDRLVWTTLEDVLGAAQVFLDPVLAGGLDATWEPAAWRSRRH